MAESEELKMYVRRSSGLVKEISAWDALIYNVLIMAPTAVYVYGVWALGIFPGVHLPTTVFLAMAISIVIGLYYAYMSIIMPRTGGDYIWVSRLIHPSIGFAINFFLFITLLSVAGSYVPWFTQYALSPLFEAYGMSDAVAWVNDPWNMFLIAAIFYVLIALLMSRGVKVTKYAFWAFFLVICAGVIAYAFTFYTMSPSTFQSSIASAYHFDPNEIVSKAIANGMPETFVLAATFSGVMYTILNFLGFNNSVYLAGEIKEVRKSQLIAIIGAVLVFGLITYIIYDATYAGMGSNFIASLAYLFVNSPENYPLGETPPFFHILARNAVSPTVFTVIVCGFAAMTLSAILVYIFTTVRLLFAWSFDRIVPQFLSKVDSRYGTPYTALITVTVVAIIAQYLWLFTPLLNYFVFVVLGWGIMTFVASHAGIILPYKRKELLELAPAIVRRKVAGVPVLVILATLSAILSIWLAWVGTEPAVSGLTPEAVIFLIGIYLVGIIIYVISSLYHRIKGIPLELAFKEFPPA